ncbi:MAG: hypothetical protein GEU81_05325 [Nitriliruptorales bacterium]|nr:hypothetical protein [Nitriliruptorales bacterium]
MGARGHPRDALALGAVVAVMHSVSVGALALGWWALAGAAPDLTRVTAVLQVVAAAGWSAWVCC